MTKRQLKTRREPRCVLYNDVLISLGELAKQTGISYPCICGRWRKGERGSGLWRPVEHATGHHAHPPEKPDTSFRGEGVAAKAREEEAAKTAALLARRQKRAARVAAIKAAHEAEFSRPFIDAALLTATDRTANADRIKFCGQRSWRMKAESV